MRARAPGKIVLSGAYAVLEGAPAIVSAVSRWVLADTDRPAEIETPEVRAAIGERPPPWFDASALREDGQKLGLGSSAAILVASLGALHLEVERHLDDVALASAVFEDALTAHARAQGGGSGIDVAASTFGGILVATRRENGLEVKPATLPPSLSVEVWASRRPSSTPALLEKVRALRASDPADHQRLLGALVEASTEAARALDGGDAKAFLDALSRQAEGLKRLGERAGAPIVTPEIAFLSQRARDEGIVVMPSGAGGGDVSIAVGTSPPSTGLRSLAIERSERALDLELGARGVHPVP